MEAIRNLVDRALPIIHRQHPAVLATAAVCSLVLAVGILKPRRVDKRMKMVLVTGSAQGLGKAITVALINRGDFVVGCDVDEDGLRELERQYPTSFLPLPMNVSNAASVSDAAARLLKYSGKPCLDAIVNNAGIIRGGPLVEMGDGDLGAILNVNVAGPFHVTKYFFPLLKRDGDGSFHPRVINFGSEVSYANLSALFNGPYAMTKFAVEAYSASLRQELMLLKNPVYVTIVNPGPHESGMTKKGNQALGARDKPSLFDAQLNKGSGPVQGYMDLFKRPASDVGESVAWAVHVLSPPRRIKLNVSFLMEIARWTPQGVIDFFIGLMF